MDNTDPRSVYPEFYNNFAIQSVADLDRWTVSDREKVPINVRELLRSGRVWGAHEISNQCLVPLGMMAEQLPNAANCAFYIRSQTDGFVVLDIEKTCPPEIVVELLKIPSFYAEYSMSGRGFHLVLPLPANFHDFPIATNKRVLRHELGWYEILLDHWVTFTRNSVPRSVAPITTDINMRSVAWERLYADLASKAVETKSAEFDISVERPDLPRIDQILELLTRKPLEKTLDDFHGDYSRFEFSTLGVMYNRLLPILTILADLEPDAEFDDSAKAWLIFEAALLKLEHRSKHNESRNGVPLLLNAAAALIAQRSFMDASPSSTGSSS